MEFNCPDCGKRLRVADNLINPLVRCRTCGHVFRPQQAAALAQLAPFPSSSRSVESDSSRPSPPPKSESAPRPKPRRPHRSEPRPTTPRSESAGLPSSPSKTNRKSKKGGGFGIGTVILLMLLLKGGANLLNFNKPNRPNRRPDPVREEPVREDAPPPAIQMPPVRLNEDPFPPPQGEREQEEDTQKEFEADASGR